MAARITSEVDWFHGDLTRAQSMAMLVDEPDGTFLIRNSSRSGCYALDLVTNEGKFLPLLIETVPDGVRLHEEPKLEIKGHEYATLVDLVAQNSTWLLYPFSPAQVGDSFENSPAVPYNPMAVESSRGLCAEDVGPTKREGDEEGEVLMRGGGGGGGGGIPSRPTREGDEVREHHSDRTDGRQMRVTIPTNPPTDQADWATD